MVNQQIEIICGPIEDRNRRRVVAKLNGHCHTDRFDVDQQFSRRNWREATISKLGLGDDAHAFLDDEILRVAAAVDESGLDTWKPSTVAMSDVQPVETQWLWDQYLPAGAISVLEGDPGLGKSQTTIDLVARLSRGDTMPPQNAPDDTFERRSSLILNAEDDPARTLAPRLQAAGANMNRVTLLRSMEDSETSDARPVSLPRDLSSIADIVKANTMGLVVIDPWVAYLDSSLSMNNDADVRRCLGQVATMAEATGCCVLLVRHLNKKSGLNAMYRGGGSIGIAGAARAVFMVGKDPTDSDSRILAPVKCNLAPEPPSLRFHIESVGATSRVRWGDACDVSASDILGAEKQTSGNKTEQAKGIIADILANGSRGSNEVLQACVDAGLSESTYHRARRDLGIVSQKTGFNDGQWLLSLPSRNGESF